MRFIFSVLLGVFSFHVLSKMFNLDESISETAGWLVGVGMLLFFEFLEKAYKKLEKKDSKALMELKDLNEKYLLVKEENQRLKKLLEKDTKKHEKEFNFLNK